MDSICIQHLGLSDPPRAADLHVISEGDCQGADSTASSSRWMAVPEPIQHYSLIYVVDRDNGKVLLGHKKRGFGKGKWNGYGGKPEPQDEGSMDRCAARELEEESNLRATSLESSGSLLFCSAPPEIDGDVNREGKTTGWSAVVHMYLCDGWEGEPAETDEMSPKWFSIEPGHEDSIPFHMMWPEARLYLPRLLMGRPLTSRSTSVSFKSTDDDDQQQQQQQHTINRPIKTRVYGRADYRGHVETASSTGADISSGSTTNSGIDGSDADGMTAWWIAST